MIEALKKQRLTSLLGLSIEGSRIEGVALRRTNGSVGVQKTFSAALSLDPLTNDPELLGREIQNHLEQAGIRERNCAVCVPLGWTLTLLTKLPDLAEADVDSFLQIEAERGFPYGPDALLISSSRFRTPAGENYATQVAIPRDHLARLEKALRAARLKPVAFSLGITALQRPDKESSQGVLALAVGESSIGLQISCGGGVAGLRTLGGALETEGSQQRLNTDAVAREMRITFGQLPGELRAAVRKVNVFGPGHLAQQLADELRPRLEPMGVKVERITEYGRDDFGVQVPAGAAVSPAFSLAARHLAGQRNGFEFLPPKIKPWQQFASRYSSGKLVWAGVAAGSIALLIALFFLFQQWQLSRYRSRWAAMAPTVTELESLQQQIRKFRPWFDDSMRSLSILRRLTEAFPEEGAVSAKTFEIREPASVTCSGVANDNPAFLKMLGQLRATKEVTDLKVEQVRGKTPLQFTFNFHWGEGSANEH